MSSEIVDKVLKRANPSTIRNKFMVGYQGWFTCAGDGEPIGPGHHGWLHWFNKPLPDGGRPNTDLWPDVSCYSTSELFPAPGLKYRNGEQAFLFSSRHPETVQRHFHWMAEHGVDGAFLQRFASECDLEAGKQGIRNLRDEIGDRVQEAAEKEGRVFAIMYDVSGVPADRLQRVIERDWIHLLHDKNVLDSPNYLREKGKAVVAIWGFGFDNAGHTPELVRAVTSFIRNNTPGGVYIMAGTPSQWRTAEGDADRNPQFLDVWLSQFDAISPWTVGRYKNEEEADRIANDRMKGDMALLKRQNEHNEGRKIDYIPVVLPGGSGYNLSEGKWELNGIKRNGGRFFWKQIANAHRLGVRIMYGAMWDEYDEGTAFMPAVTTKRQLPVHEKFPFLALDADGYDLPSDWYMRICGFAAEGLRSERVINDTFPNKELQDYWATRPVFEERENESGAGPSAAGGVGGSGGDGGQSYQDWLAGQKDDKDEIPPPPYTLVEEESQPQPAAAPSRAQTLTQFGQTGLSWPTSPVQTTNSPPPIKSSTRPQRAATTADGDDGGMASLANEFGRQKISGGYPPAGPPRVNSISRPPVHPASKTAAGGTYSSYYSPTPPPASSRPQSSNASRPSQFGGKQQQAQSPQSQSPQMPSFPFAASEEQPQTPGGGKGPWSQAPWPPPEWKIPQQQQQQQQHGYQSESGSFSSYYAGQATGVAGAADIHRQQSMSGASSSASAASSAGRRVGGPGGGGGGESTLGSWPHAPSIGAPSSGPGSALHVGAGSATMNFPVVNVAEASRLYSNNNNSPISPSFNGPFISSSNNNNNNHNTASYSFPSGPDEVYHMQQATSYAGQTQTGAYGAGPAPIIPGHQQQQAMPSFGQPEPTISPTYGYGGNMPSYPGQQQSGGPYAAAGGGGSYQGQAGQAGQPQFPFGFEGSSHDGTYYAPGYAPSYGTQTASSSYLPSHHHQPYQPYQPYHEQTNTSTTPPPPMHPRPPMMGTTQIGYGSGYGGYGGYNSGGGSSGSGGPSGPKLSGVNASGAVGMALSAVDKVGGQKMRKQLEQQVGNLAQSGSKLFGKLK
ncbi:hypothetical protein AMATHDRAFT_65829 [Amanita thiersii Skay4041]|uniref:Xylosidase/arabinosidase n=1 Tax=Amanita thiersii Skay4041 TaxID=703135 RepID=A0A2A9NB77_9AGAR|nr:hypothetical protein AMATHDRAFT_65829 [Amanita thiersii Skay4041]